MTGFMTSVLGLLLWIGGAVQVIVAIGCVYMIFRGNGLLFKALSVAVLVVLLAISPGYNWWSVSEVTVVIDSKERDPVTEVYTISARCLAGCSKSVEQFNNTDNWWHLKTASRDMQVNLAVGGKYVLKVNGFRNSWLSLSRNILDIEKVISDPLAVKATPCDHDEHAS